jgi:hypothetical protein
MLCDEIEFDRMLGAAATVQAFRNNSFARKEIEVRAYEIHVSRGAIHGHHLEDWLQAERDVMAARRVRV